MPTDTQHTGMGETNPNARYLEDEWHTAPVRYPERWRETRFRLAIGPRNGVINGFYPEDPKVSV